MLDKATKMEDWSGLEKLAIKLAAGVDQLAGKLIDGPLSERQKRQARVEDSRPCRIAGHS